VALNFKLSKPTRNEQISIALICVVVAWFVVTYLATEFFPFVPSGEGPR
jgi:hypothetical protein